MELGIGQGAPIAEVHEGHCYSIGKRRRPITREQAISLLSDGVRACVHCRPESRLRRVAAAVWPPAVLLAAAVALPWLPAVAQAPAVADGVRVTLVITAVLGLVLPRESSARASILDTLNKALHFRSEK